jgi:SLT domain-containing protein
LLHLAIAKRISCLASDLETRGADYGVEVVFAENAETSFQAPLAHIWSAMAFRRSPLGEIDASAGVKAERPGWN